MADNYKKDEDENKKKYNYLNPNYPQKNLKKCKRQDDDTDGGEGSGGGSEGIEFDWKLLAQGQLDCPIGPNETQAQKQHKDILPYSLPLGAKDLAQQKDTYRAQKAKTAISKGDRNTQNMYYLESQNQAENGPQANPNPLN
jgi:hypothetical protein